jgi:hypothetical protein
MTDQSGAAPADTVEPAAGATGEDEMAQQLLAEAVSAADQGVEQLGDAGKRALDRMNQEAKAARAQLAEALAKLKEYEDRDKTEAQKLAERAAEAEKAAAAKAAEVLRLRIALKHQISDEDAEIFLTGSDEETLTRQAERLVALRGEPRPRTPAPDPTQGARGPVDIDAQIRDAEAKGDVRAAIRLKNQKLLAQNSR